MPALPVTVAGQPFDIVPFLIAESNYGLFFKSAYDAFFFSDNSIQKVTDPDYPGFSSVVPTSITRTGAVATITLPDPTNWQSGSTVVVAGAAQTEYNGEHQITVIDATHVSYAIAGTPASPATGSITVLGGRVTVPGIVYLDGYFFVMDQNAVIYNSGLKAPLEWNALDFIGAESEPGNGVAIAKSQSYIIAMKSWSTEFFYDAGNPVGSPLSPVQNAFTMIGCAVAESVASIDDTIIWVSKTRQKGRAVHLMVGLSQKKVSTADVERVLNGDTLENVYSYGVRVSGHTFYVLGLRNSGVTLVYDSISETWCVWTSLTARAAVPCAITSSNGTAVVDCPGHGFGDGDAVTVAGAVQAEYNGLKQINVTGADSFTFPVPVGAVSPTTGTISVAGYDETYFKYTKYVYASGRDLVIHEDTGTLCEITESSTNDDGIPINFLIRTSEIDRGNVDPKTNHSAEVIGNKVGGEAMIRWTDNDYASYSKFRRIDLSAKNSVVRRLGSFTRRAYELRHVADSQVQVSALELEIK